MDGLEGREGGWNCIKRGRNETEILLDSETSVAGKVFLLGLVSLGYGVGFLFVPVVGLPGKVPEGLILVGGFLIFVRLLLSEYILWDLSKKRAFKVVSFAGSRTTKDTYEGDEVFVVVVESSTTGRYGLSLLTRFGNRFQVLPTIHDRDWVREDAEKLARYFDCSVKEGTPGVVPWARAARSPQLKWKKRPNAMFRTVFQSLLLLLPLLVHIGAQVVDSASSSSS